jgi:magnesium-transporting ATPase (P-type)
MEIENEIDLEDALRILFSSQPIFTKSFISTEVNRVTSQLKTSTKPLQTESLILKALTRSIDSSDYTLSSFLPALQLTLIVFLILFSLFLTLLIVLVFRCVRSRNFNSPPSRPSFVLSNVSFYSIDHFMFNVILI